MQDIKRLQEDLRVLSYPQEISILSFSSPNFRLMSEILTFLVLKLDPGCIIKSLLTEQDRIKFIKDVTILVALQTPVTLNTRSLYKSEGGSVKELRKLSQLLVSYLSTPKPDYKSRLELSNFQRDELRRCRQLARELTETGAELFHLLENEGAVKDRRNGVLAAPVELPETAKQIQSYITALQKDATTKAEAYESLLSDQQNLTTKFDRKKSELERTEKRLKSLLSVRPAYMDEYERIEQELVVNYQTYMTKFRNLAYLEQLLDAHNAEERERAEKVEVELKGLQKRMKEEELEMMRREKEADVIGGGIRGNFGGYREEVNSDTGEEISLSNDEHHSSRIRGDRPKGAKHSHANNDSPSPESSLDGSQSDGVDFDDNDF